MPTTLLTHCRFGSFRIDLKNRQLWYGDSAVALTPKAFDTLAVLVVRRGQAVSKEELIEAVWPESFVSEATLTQNIYTLRKALLAADPDASFIENLPRRGYRLDVKVLSGGIEAQASLSAGVEAPHGGAPEEDIRSIAVLPLRTLGDEEAVFLGLGLADALITSLGNVRQLAVRATSAILPYVDEPSPDPVQVGNDLGVEGVLEGTVQRAGARLRVTLQLVSVARGVPCWADSFQGLYDDLFEAQDAIAKAVVVSLRLRLTRGEEARLVRRQTYSLEGRRAYVRGRYFWNRRTAADLRRAIELFHEAVAYDPEYAQAHAGLADAFILLPFYGGALPADAFRRGREAAKRALDLDGELAEAHTSLAYTEFVYQRRWDTAEEGFLRAIGRKPNYPTAHIWYAFLLTALGRHDEALERARRAHELDPLSLVIHTDLALSYYFARRFEDSLEQLASVLEVASDFAYVHFGLGLTLGALGRHSEAVVAARRATELSPDSSAMLSALGHALASDGRMAEARAVLRTLDDLAEFQPVQAGHRALVLVGLGECEAALAETRRACEQRSRFAAFLGVWPVFDSLRGDPRYIDLLHLIRIPSSAASRATVS